MCTYTQKLHYVDAYFCLKGAPESNNKRVLSKCEDVPLVEDLLNLLLHDHTMLANLLHGKPLVSLLVPNQVDSTERERGREGERGERERERERDGNLRR